MNEHQRLDGHERETNEAFSSSPESDAKTPRRRRIFALIGAILMIALTILYAYSIASGKIFAW